jgi:hypothetical protein
MGREEMGIVIAREKEFIEIMKMMEKSFLREKRPKKSDRNGRNRYMKV